MRALALSLLSTFLVGQNAPTAPQPLKLPAPSLGSVTLEKALKERQSVRTLGGPALSVGTLSSLLWAAQGENRPGTGKRTVPSASAGYPLELYVIVTKSDALADGVYRYSTKEHNLTKIKDGGPDAILGPIANMQAWIPKCPAVFVIAGVPSRFRGNDPARKETNTYWESGAAAQALLLAVTASGLGATPANGVNLEAIHSAMGLPSEEKVTLIVPVGNIVK